MKYHYYNYWVGQKFLVQIAAFFVKFIYQINKIVFVGARHAAMQKIDFNARLSIYPVVHLILAPNRAYFPRQIVT